MALAVDSGLGQMFAEAVPDGCPGMPGMIVPAPPWAMNQITSTTASSAAPPATHQPMAFLRPAWVPAT